MLKTWPLLRMCVCVRACVHPCVRAGVRTCVRACVRACVCVYGWGGQDVITIRTSIMIPLSATVSSLSTARGVGGAGRGGAVVTNAVYSHNACWYMRALYNNGNEHRR